MAAGLRVGDIIISIMDDKLVESLDHFKEVGLWGWLFCLVHRYASCAGAIAGADSGQI